MLNFITRSHNGCVKFLGLLALTVILFWAMCRSSGESPKPLEIPTAVTVPK